MLDLHNQWSASEPVRAGGVATITCVLNDINGLCKCGRLQNCLSTDHVYWYKTLFDDLTEHF